MEGRTRNMNFTEVCNSLYIGRVPLQQLQPGGRNHIFLIKLPNEMSYII